jgi:hypothetical protein
MRGIREVAVKPTLLHVDTVWVDHFTAGTGGVGKELRMRNHKSVSESGSDNIVWASGFGILSNQARASILLPLS